MLFTSGDTEFPHQQNTLNNNLLSELFSYFWENEVIKIFVDY